MSSPMKQALNESNSNDNDSNDDSNFKNKRLVIHKLSLINFKSFAGKQIIGPFHKSFSAIVGPNGSGKSNTIDALLFVFGYRASKMRQSKLSELIHNSAEHPNCDHCAVEVHFRDIVDTPGSEEYEVVPNSHLVVTRMAMRNNQSKYLINDETSNYNEVTHLLRDRGIDLDHNRFLILQGEVEQIAQMKSKAPSPHEDGLLEYLEDIIGTAKYKQSIEDSLIEMDKLSDERSERLGRLRIVEKEKDRLEGYKGEAEGYLKDVNVVVRKKNKLYQRYLFDLNENIQICIEQSQQLTSDLQSKESKIKGRRQLINDLESSYNNLDKDVKKVENEMKKVSKSHEDKNKENVKLDVKIKDLNSKIKKLNKVIQDDKHSQSEAEHSLASLSEDIEKARKELDEYESGLGSEEEKLETIIDSLKGKTQQFTDQIEVKQKELQPWQAKISDKQTKIDVAQSERQLLTDKSQSAQNAVIDAEKSLEDLLNDVQIKKNSVEEINDKRNNISDQMKESEISLKDMRNKEIYARNDLANARQKADEAKASLTANRSQDAVLATLNRLRDTGRVSGFHGRLGNLGVIDDKYDVAITTACGALNNFVVDTVNAAQTCIKHLRENNVGRASFIVLEQLPKRDVGKIQTPENVPRLIDLVKVKKNNFIPAFFKALGNTLVAKDLAQGNRIAYGKQRWRVVTLQGNVIDTSGTMSGGGQRVLKGGMGSTFSNSSNEVVTIDQVHQLQSEADRLEENLHEINEKVQKIEIEYKNFEKIIPELDIEIEKAEIDQSTFKKRISESKKYVEKMKAESKPNKSDLNRIKDLDNLIESLTEEINDLKSKTEKIESEITGLQDKILEVGGVKLRAQKSKVDGIKTMMSIANETITKSEVSLTKAQKDFEKYKKSIKNNQSKLEEIEIDLNEINKKNENQISKANNVKNEVESLRKIYESKVDELSELKQQLDSEASEMQSFNNFESDIKSKIEEINNMHRDSEHKVQIYNERLSKLELQDVEEEKEEEDDKEKEGGVVKMDEEADVIEPIKGQSLELERYSNDDLANVETDKLKKEILRCEEKIDKSSVNLEVLNEYKKRKEEYKNRADDVQHVTKQRDEAKDKYDELRKKRLDEFMHGFTIISSKLKEMYQMITLGGNAELELVDSLDPFSEGIIFSVMPPKKSWKNISNLSGGEKTLSSLALVFALHAFKPTPLYFMDEIDAALDFRNVSIVANYIRDRTKDAQFIIISLRNDMFELSNRLVGIYKTMNATKSLTIENKKLIA